ncbi:class I adenylate-forming enzyme family protein [Candidatus Latescibacterota bacterium]
MLFKETVKSTIYFQNKSYSPTELETAISDFQRRVLEKVPATSPFIYLFASNHIKTVISFLALVRAGKKIILVDPKIGKIELSEIMNDTPPAVFVKFDESTIGFNYNKEISYFEYPEPIKLHNDLSDVCIMVYTAGNDGYSKAAMLTYDSLDNNACSVVNVANLSPETVSCAALPLHHLYGLQTGLIAPLVAGGQILIPKIDNLINMKVLADEFCQYSVTHLYAPPLLYLLMVIDPEVNHQLASIMQFTSGGSKLSAHVYEKFKAKFDSIIQEGYGLTEASPICSWHKPDDEVCLGSVGKKDYFADIASFDSIGNKLRLNQSGELCIKGKNLMKGYYGHRQLSCDIFNNGWLRTGDLGFIDEYGYVFLTGLKKKMLNVAGQKVFIPELSRHLLMYQDLVSCNIGATHSPVKGDVIEATVSLRYDTAEQRRMFEKWVRENLSAYRIPRRFIYTNC